MRFNYYIVTFVEDEEHGEPLEYVELMNEDGATITAPKLDRLIDGMTYAPDGQTKYNFVETDADGNIKRSLAINSGVVNYYRFAR